MKYPGATVVPTRSTSQSPMERATSDGFVLCDDGTLIVGLPIGRGLLMFVGLCPSCWQMPLPPGGEQCLRCDADDADDARRTQEFRRSRNWGNRFS